MDVSFIKYRVYSSGIPFEIEPLFLNYRSSWRSWGAAGDVAAEGADLCLVPARLS